ncbi:MAG: hypothetical protein LUD80_01315, partial [Clostridiales bacterium]|nr:hypothetical protein [Clostridiales bacterium]
METIMAERAFCGAVPTDTDAVFWPEARSILSVDEFTNPECKAIFEAACALLDRTGEASRVAIARAAGITNSAALDYMTQNPTGTNAVELAKMIHSDAIARAAADVCNGLERRFLAGGEDVQGLLTEATQSFERLLQGE